MALEKVFLVFLVFWAVVLCGVLIAAAWTLKARAAEGDDVARDRRVDRWSITFVLGGSTYVFCCLLIYGLLCGIRGVDIGIGDWRSVLLCQGHTLAFIDDTESGAIYPGPNGGEAMVSRIAEMGEDGPYVFGDGFILDTRNSHLTREPDRSALLRDLARLGIDHPRFVSAWAFYTRRRWTLTDLVLFLLLSGAGVTATFLTFSLAWNGPPCPGEGTES